MSIDDTAGLSESEGARAAAVHDDDAGAGGGGRGQSAAALAGDEDAIVVGAEDGSAGQDPVGEGEGEAHKPRRRSRMQRYRERIARLQAELTAARDVRRGGAGDRFGEPREPDVWPDDPADDHAAGDVALQEAQMQARRDAEAALRDRLAGYNARLDALKSRIPDFDQVLRETGRSEIRNDVRDLILGSAKGPLIAYYLAKNPDALDDINRMPPAEAARRIGNLEARIRGPGAPAATAAKAPVVPPRGGASASRALDPQRMSHEEYRRARADGRI